MFTPCLAQYRDKLRFPLPHGFMRKDYASFQEHFRQSPQTHLIADPPQLHETNDIGGILGVVEARPGTFIELPLTRRRRKRR
jgi:hypothetical protein